MKVRTTSPAVERCPTHGSMQDSQSQQPWGSDVKQNVLLEAVQCVHATAPCIHTSGRAAFQQAGDLRCHLTPAQAIATFACSINGIDNCWNQSW